MAMDLGIALALIVSAALLVSPLLGWPLGWLFDRCKDRREDRRWASDDLWCNRLADALVRLLQEPQGDPHWPPGMWVETTQPRSPFTPMNGESRLTLTRSVEGVRVVVAFHHHLTGEGWRPRPVDPALSRVAALHLRRHVHGSAVWEEADGSVAFTLGEREWARVILLAGNTERRRAAIEAIGWPEFIRWAELTPVAEAVDPGNPGRMLRLYDVPFRGDQGPVRMLVMTNGSPDRSGADRVYAEPVPPTTSDPIAAAAWQYDVPRETYLALQRRT